MTPEKQAINEGVRFLRKAGTEPLNGYNARAANKILHQVANALTSFIAYNEGISDADARVKLKKKLVP